MKTTYEYDAAGNIVRQSVTGDTSIDLEYSYDLRGNLIREKRSEQGSTVTSNYSYDALGRISSFATSDGYSENYSYDAAGNMTLKQAGDIQIRMSYNAADQMVGMESAYGRIDYTYNANGDLTDKISLQGFLSLHLMG